MRKETRNALGAVAVLLALSACGGSDDKPRPTAAGPGRDETALIRNTENIGYAGNAIGGKVDKALQANEDRTADLDHKLGEDNGSE